jgi:Tfp pilus assembly protein PilF
VTATAGARRPPGPGAEGGGPGRSVGVALALLATAALCASCATTPPPVSKIVAGKVVLTRAIHPDAYEHVARAQLFQQEERWEQAIDELERALGYDRDSPEIHAQIAELRLELGQDEAAAKAVEASLALGETVVGLVAQAHVRQRRHDPAAAVVSLRRATEVANFAEAADVASNAHLELADAQLETLDIGGARQTLQNLADDDPNSTVARMRLASVAWSLGAMTDVERRLREALAIEPNQVEALLTLAWLATANGRLDDAEARFRDALERAEGALDVATAFARFLVLAGRGEEAGQLADDLGSAGDDETLVERIELFRAAHRSERALALARERRARPEISEDLAARLDMLTADLLAEKSPTEAIALLLRVPKSAPAFSSARLRAAELLQKSAQPTEARRLLNEIEVDPPTDGLRDEIAVAQSLLDEKINLPKEALGRLAIAVAKRPHSARLRLARAALFERQGRVQDALAEAEILLRDDPGNAEALNFWGFLAADHQIELPRAQLRIEAALAFDPGSGAILDSLGWAHLQAGALDRAALYLEQAGHLEPEDPEILSHLALLSERKGQAAAALAYVHKALGRTPEPALRGRLESQERRLQQGSAGGKGNGRAPAESKSEERGSAGKAISK